MDDQKSAISQFHLDCTSYIKRGRKILEFQKSRKPDATFRLESIFNDTEEKLQKLDKFISDKATCPKGGVIASTAVGGAAVGAAIGAPCCVFDAGVLSVLFSIIGGAAGMIMSSCGTKLGPLLVAIIDNMRKIQKHVADAYGFKSKFSKQN